MFRSISANLVIQITALFNSAFDYCFCDLLILNCKKIMLILLCMYMNVLMEDLIVSYLLIKIVHFIPM